MLSAIAKSEGSGRREEHLECRSYSSIHLKARSYLGAHYHRTRDSRNRSLDQLKSECQAYSLANQPMKTLGSTGSKPTYWAFGDNKYVRTRENTAGKNTRCEIPP